MSRRVLTLALFAIVAAPAGEAPAPVAPPAPAATTAKPADKSANVDDAASKLSEEERWVFEPVSGRVDPFYDLRVKMRLERTLAVPDSDDSPDWRPPVGVQRSDYAKMLMQRVESAIVAKKWDEAIKTCDSAIKQLSKDVGNDEAAALIEKFKRYRTQAEEAKTYEEAQAKFDALDLRIEGILWSPEGSLAVINGEPRARGVNERVKDCVIINIDTNRVDFLFHHNRRRFEFQRYVGEDAKTSAKKEDGR